MFTLQYPVIEFVIPAGVAPFTTSVIARNQISNGFAELLRDNEFTPEDVDLVGGYRARLVAVDGNDLAEIERIDVRACPVGNPNGCTDLRFNLFSISNNYNRRQQSVNLNPSPVNLRELFLTQEAFRFEIVIFPGQTTSVPIEARLEWEVQAVGDLD